MKELNTFYTELKAASVLSAGFAKAVKENDIAAFLKAHEVDATAEEFMALTQGEMTDQQLDAVAGGANWGEALLSIFSLGVGCAFAAIESATGAGVGNGPKGCLLCNNSDWV